MQVARNSASDEELLQLFLKGDEAAFVALMRRYKEPITTYTYRFLGNYDDAVDVAQETFVRLYRFGHSFVGEVKFSTWLYTIASNLARTELKRYRRRNGVSLGEAFSVGEDESSWDIPDETYMPDELVDSTRIAQDVQKALLSISPSYREMVVLRDVQQLTYEEIAVITNTEMGTVKSRINRGRAQLQVLLRSLYNEVFPSQE
ncbi:MAG: sigma-70 family RNA polymerase sigma factor [Candidatus Kapabacteria bacterium]|nr:sigma-70 family RNA polymerase sigma factor [Candidatus Kapabacteria bacterium]MBP7092576.1 sigma-70 family RNA polymerase sigma factor [Candidatus Kapabacteria bacterium]